jgi:hypothetical protein
MIPECLTGGTPKLCTKESLHSHHPRAGVDPVIMGSPRWCVHHMTGCCFSLSACCLGGRYIVICPEKGGVKNCACPERWCLVLQGQERPCNLLRIWVTVHQLSSVHIWSPVSDSTTVVIRLSPHLDLGVLMRTYPNVADLALYCSSLWIGIV